jgi:hypothetical protein
MAEGIIPELYWLHGNAQSLSVYCW